MFIIESKDMINKYPVLNKNCHIHYFGNISFIDDLNNIKDEYFYIDLDEVGTDIIQFCDGLTSIENLHQKIVLEYSLDSNDIETKELLLQFINNLVTKGVLDLKDMPCDYGISQSGERGKLYPFILNLELTDSCNLRCKHCYKEATIGQGAFLNNKQIQEILESFKRKTPVINIIGGEPSLHPDINDILSKSTDDFSVTLISNGTKLDLIKDENISKLRSTQLSMYGYDEESYEKATGNSAVFLNFCNGIKKLKKNNVYSSVAIIINKDNLNELEKYINALIDLKVDEIKFGLASLHGRAINDRDRWIFNQTELRQLQAVVNMYHEKYKNIIKINIWGDNDFIYDDFREAQCKKQDKYNLNCVGGKTVITISEKGRVRPCSYLPSEFFDMGSYDQYLKKILEGKECSFNCSMQKYEQYLNAQGVELSDIRCKGFS